MHEGVAGIVHHHAGRGLVVVELQDVVAEGVRAAFDADPEGDGGIRVLERFGEEEPRAAQGLLAFDGVRLGGELAQHVLRRGESPGPDDGVGARRVVRGEF